MRPVEVNDYLVVSEAEIVAVVPAGAVTATWRTDVDGDGDRQHR